MKVVKSIVAAAILPLAAVPPIAHAQSEQRSETGSRFGKQRFNNDRDARSTLSYFGKCVAARKSERIASFLRNPSDDTWKPLVNFPNGETACLDYSMKSSYREMRGSLAEGWYLRAYPGGPPSTFIDNAGEPPSQDEFIARITATDPDDRPMVIVDEFARCVVAIAPIASDALLRTKVETTEERAAIGRLSPNFGPCAFEGQTLKFDEGSLRAALSFALASRAVQAKD